MDKRPTIRLIWGLSGLISLLFSHTLLAVDYYRWQDEKGRFHYADERPSEEITSEKISVDGGDGFYRVAKVYDGDTVVLDGGEKVRLIGINTPEVAYRNRPADPGGNAAGDYLRQLIKGELVRLEYGRERRDKYGRTLAHLFTEDGTNINALMLSEGYAHAVIKIPNTRLLAQYLDAEQLARESGLGIWKLAQFQLQPIEQAAVFRNTFRRLQGSVIKVTEKKSAWLLHFKAGVKVLIRKEHLGSFIRDGVHPNSLVNRRLIVRGWVHSSRGKPLIRLRDSRAIERAD